MWTTDQDDMQSTRQLQASTDSLLNVHQNFQRSVRFLIVLMKSHVRHSYGGGGTRLIHALKTAYNLPRIDKNSARTMVVITDGYVSVEKEAFQLIENNLDKANVFTFGIGYGCDVDLCKRVAEAGRGDCNIIDDGKSKELKAKVVNVLRKASEPTL